MSLWDFVKDAGKSVFGEAQAAEPQTAPKQATPQAAPQASSHAAPKAAPEPVPSRDDADTRRKLDALNAEVAALGLDSGDVRLHLKGDTVTVVSKGADRATMEKLILAVGNVKGIARVEADLPEDAAASRTMEPVFHEVETGDNLSKIARKYLGDANRYQEIFEANKPMLSDPDKIYPGQKLRIPQS
ncbi:peptidoglycan-binding protein LysM [Paracoccus sp. MC1862]|uniref:peptidoglycan-binding protein LysM n=1 Tax=Paracoccus sp. MC1862 TaxID=2760307 RepID=UPI0015FF75B1|nr:peptidoglycan-binding protein LysM [Paracoccus sp. MC1862]MBB1499088.1 peptidoglycan-binding protein LysM [Paracoccus sp. MC1862]QQO46599.1 peptidoglycan-binding protein LysM [Paracoccus sp. MC1862]